MGHYTAGAQPPAAHKLLPSFSGISTHMLIVTQTSYLNEKKQQFLAYLYIISVFSNGMIFLLEKKSEK